MEGLEISEIKYSEYIQTYRLRLDSDYYLKAYLANEKYLASKNSIKDISFSNILNIKNLRLKKDFNYLEISGIKSNSLSYSYNKINFKEIPDRATYILSNNDVVVSTVRPNRNSVAFIHNANRLIGTSGLTVLRADSTKISPYYLFVFCKTKFFITKLMRENTATMYPAVSDYDVLNVKIPILSISFQQIINNKIEHAFKCIKQSQSLYKQAERLLLETLGLNDFRPSQETINIKPFKESFLEKGRLDAEYYQLKYEEYTQLIKNYQNGFGLIKTICNLKDSNFNPDKTKEYQYIELSDIGNSGNIMSCTLALGDELPTRARIKVNANDVIISSIEGSLSSCTLIQNDYDNALCSTGFYVINCDKINSETLLVLFKSEVMQNLLKQGCSGTILTAINKSEFQNIPIPIIDITTQGQIASLINESFSLRKESERLLEEAKEMVEKEIGKLY